MNRRVIIDGLALTPRMAAVIVMAAPPHYELKGCHKEMFNNLVKLGLCDWEMDPYSLNQRGREIRLQLREGTQ